MKLIRSLVVLALAAGFASLSFAASDAPMPLTRVPKNEAAMQATAAEAAKDAAHDSVKSASKKSKSKGKTKGKPAKTKSLKGHKTKAPHHGRAK